MHAWITWISLLVAGKLRRVERRGIACCGVCCSDGQPVQRRMPGMTWSRGMLWTGWGKSRGILWRRLGGERKCEVRHCLCSTLWLVAHETQVLSAALKAFHVSEFRSSCCRGLRRFQRIWTRDCGCVVRLGRASGATSSSTLPGSQVDGVLVEPISPQKIQEKQCIPLYAYMP